MPPTKSKLDLCEQASLKKLVLKSAIYNRQWLDFGLLYRIHKEYCCLYQRIENSALINLILFAIFCLTSAILQLSWHFQTKGNFTSPQEKIESAMFQDPKSVFRTLNGKTSDFSGLGPVYVALALNTFSSN